MLIYLDESLKTKLTGCTIDSKAITPLSRESHAVLSEKTKYPAITYFRFDKKFDIKNIINDLVYEEYNLADPTNDEAVADVCNIYEPPKPFRFMYQIELLAKERYHIDMMELFMDKTISDPRGFEMELSFKINPSDENSIKIKCVVELMEYKPLDEVEDKQLFYRRIYTLIVKTFIEFNVLKEEAVYLIKNVNIQSIKEQIL